MRGSEYIPNDEKESWITSLKAGEEDVLIALALMLFPNLTSIDIQDPRLTPRVERMIRRITDAIYPDMVPLAKLISVTIGTPDSNFCIDLKTIELFATLPSVQTVNAAWIGGKIEILEHIVPTKGSNVTDLNVMYGDVLPQRLMLFLQSFGLLQSFRYWPASSPHLEHDFDPFSIVTNQLACAQVSLRELQIRAGSTTKKYMGSLCTFCVLEHLDTDTMILFGDSYSLVQNFQTCLPPSIQEVKLHGEHRNNNALRLHLTSLVES